MNIFCKILLVFQTKPYKCPLILFFPNNQNSKNDILTITIFIIALFLLFHIPKKDLNDNFKNPLPSWVDSKQHNHYHFGFFQKKKWNKGNNA